MSLTTYKKKRSFNRTPEPAGDDAKTTKGSLTFVVQKHDASHLHYDFRLEMEGVLKSWAVPKGPSMDPAVKRLAMMVEDHPYDYRTFEGTIPEGNYGAGTVMVWDQGTYNAADETFSSKQAEDKALRHGLHAGKIKFTLHGKKLSGEFALVKTSGRGENAWLLMKLDDEYATTDDILANDKSVKSGKTMEQLEKKAPAKTAAARKTPATKRATATKRTTSAKKTAAQKKSPEQDEPSAKTPAKARTGKARPKPVNEITGAASAPFYTTVIPMLATLVDKPFNDDGWSYEIKWDGYRAVAFMNGDTFELKSRNDKSFNKKFYPVYKAIQQWGVRAIVDGEIVAVSDSGVPDFGTLQNWRSEADGQLMYYVFDILWLDGKDLTPLPLRQRREILQSIVPATGLIRLSDSFEINGKDFYRTAQEIGLEGILAKRLDSHYLPGVRTLTWLKIKANKRQEVVIGGYTRNENTSKLFSALLVGVFDNGKFTYTGKIGTGFTDGKQREMMAMFKPLVTGKAPFDSEPDYNKPSRFNPRPSKATATWLQPKIVCEVSFTEMTSDGVMRHPSFQGLRTDKEAHDVTRDRALSTPQAVEQATGEVARKLAATATDHDDRKTLLNPTEETQVKQVNGHAIKFTNLSKIYWPDEKVTKRDMLNYYYQVAPYIMPYIKDRPQSLNRFPNGIYGKSFYQKDVTGKVPDWVHTYLYHSSDEADRDKHFLVPDDESSLLLMASMGCIEINPWSSRIDRPDHPDWCIIDLDPDKNSFDQVIEAARVTHELLDSIGVANYCKTSGSTGLHIYIPMGAKYTYEQSKEFARIIAKAVHKELPRFTSIERAVANRGGKMYVDFLQNRPKATLAAPYSLRPKPGATVSMPLHWDEVKKGLRMKDFTIFNAMARIRETGDLFAPVLGPGVDLEKTNLTLPA